MANTKKTIGKTSMTIDKLIKLRGGFKPLDTKALNRKYRDEQKTAEQWVKELTDLTFFDKDDDINKKLLSTEMVEKKSTEDSEEKSS
jgi:hypothetical protein